MEAKKETSVLMLVVSIILETLQEAGENGMPSGHLYMALSTKGMTLNTYNQIISALKKCGKITEENYLLKIKNN